MVTFGKQWCDWCQDHTQWDGDSCLSCKEAIAEEKALRAINAELLEVAKEALVVIDTSTFLRTAKKLRAAIAKAEGE